MKPVLAFLVLSSLSVISATAQQSGQVAPWSGIVDTKRAIDWSTTSPGIVGGIPTNRTQCGATISAYSGTAAAINTQVQNAACANKFVLLGAGTFTLSTMLDFNGANNVTLRGAGPNATFIIMTAAVPGTGCGGLGANICVFNNGLNNTSGGVLDSPRGDHACLWTAGYAQGATSITLNTCGAGFVAPGVNDVIILDQLDDTTDTGATYTSRGTFVCQVQNVCGNDVPGGQGRPNRAQAQMVKVTSISGSGTGPYTVGITPGLYGSNWNVGPDTKTPGMWWAGSPIHDVGIENLSLDMTASAAATAGIYLFNAYNAWVKNVRTINPARNSVWCYESNHVEVRDSYFYGAQGTGSQSYGFEGYLCSDPKVENNISERVVAPFIFDITYGAVVAYNFSIAANYVLATWLIPSHDMHAAGNAYNLFEGNIGFQHQEDDIHGTGFFSTVYRNRLRGFQEGKTQQTTAVYLYTQHRFHNIVANVLGDSAAHTNYKHCWGVVTGCSHTDDGTGNASIVNMGMCGNNGAFSLAADGCGVGLPNDDNVVTSTLLWGNWDTVTNANRWCGSSSDTGWVAVCGSQSETVTAGGAYANAVPTKGDTAAGQAGMPASLYLGIIGTQNNCGTGLSWWKTPSGCPPFPPIGPEVAGGNIVGTGGHAYKTPAALCWDSLATLDTNYTSGNQATISAISEAGTTVTITATANWPAAFVLGGVIHLAGTSSANYNNTKYAVATISGATLTFTAPAGLSSATGGTATSNPVYLFNADKCYAPDTKGGNTNSVIMIF